MHGGRHKTDETAPQSFEYERLPGEATAHRRDSTAASSSAIRGGVLAGPEQNLRRSRSLRSYGRPSQPWNVCRRSVGLMGRWPGQSTRPGLAASACDSQQAAGCRPAQGSLSGRDPCFRGGDLPITLISGSPPRPGQLWPTSHVGYSTERCRAVPNVAPGSVGSWKSRPDNLGKVDRGQRGQSCPDVEVMFIRENYANTIETSHLSVCFVLLETHDSVPEIAGSSRTSKKSFHLIRSPEGAFPARRFAPSVRR